MGRRNNDMQQKSVDGAWCRPTLLQITVNFQYIDEIAS